MKNERKTCSGEERERQGHRQIFVKNKKNNKKYENRKRVAQRSEREKRQENERIANEKHMK